MTFVFCLLLPITVFLMFLKFQFKNKKRSVSKWKTCYLKHNTN